MTIIVFENSRVRQLYPITFTRPPCDILCGGTTLYHALRRVFPRVPVHLLTRPYLQALEPKRGRLPARVTGQVLLIDASVAPNLGVIAKLVPLVVRGRSFVVRTGKSIVAASFDAAAVSFHPRSFSQAKAKPVEAWLASLKLSLVRLPLSQLEYPEDVVAANHMLVGANVSVLARGLKEIRPEVFVGPGVTLAPQVVCDVSAGPIIIGARSRVAELVILRGPLAIGEDCVVNSFTEIKGGCSIGEVCRVGGEVEASIIQGYSNKQHYGYLGHAYVGSWVNLGAGTTNSDLKNTYGEVKVQGRPTGQQFMGCVIGDYSKTAVGTLLYTGKVVGVCGLLYGTITRDVPAFTNATKEFVNCPLEVACKMQRTMFARRKVRVTPAHQRLLKIIYEQTASDRKQAHVAPAASLSF